MRNYKIYGDDMVIILNINNLYECYMYFTNVTCNIHKTPRIK